MHPAAHHPMDRAALHLTEFRTRRDATPPQSVLARRASVQMRSLVLVSRRQASRVAAESARTFRASTTGRRSASRSAMARRQSREYSQYIDHL